MGWFGIAVIVVLTMLCTGIAGMWMLEQAERNLYSQSSANAEKFNTWYRQIIGELRIYKNYIEKSSRDGTPTENHIQQSAYENFVYPDGVYLGTISGKYVDAIGWKPPAGYRVTERPWFADALKTVDFAITEPYIDAFTGAPCVTISTRLSDMQETTVMAADVFLDYARELVNHISGRKMVDGAVFITGANRLIVADSEVKGERKDFTPQTELHRKLAELIEERDIEQTTVTADGETFYINIHHIIGINWYLITYVRASTVWMEVGKSFAVIFGLQLMILLLITVTFRQKEDELDESKDEAELRARVNDALNKDFFIHAIIDLKNDGYRVFYQADFVRDQVTSLSAKAGETLIKSVEAFVEEPFKPMMLGFVDLNTLPERIKDKPRLTAEYCSRITGSWCRCSFLPIFFDDEGNVTHVLYSVQSTEGEILYLRDKLRIEETIVECIRTLTASTGFNDSIQRMLRILGEYYKADRAYMYSVDREANVANMEQEWCAEGVAPTFADRNQVSLSKVDAWVSEMDGEGKRVIENIDELEASREDYVTVLRKKGVSNLCHVRVGSDSREYRGLLGIENRKDNLSADVLLTSVASFMSEELIKKEYTETLYELSYKDMLTDVMNRHAFMRDVKAMNEDKSKNVGVIFVDVNGLKQTNDQLGHEMGDEIIKRTAAILKDRFGRRSVYRLGGDEFVTICQTADEEGFNAVVGEVSAEGYGLFSVGEAWIDVCTDIEHQVKIADKRMYKRKREYYETQGNDRRRMT
ncbi:MAG: sensor domain-containing diguanylate cyclase [Selenomonadaceae bacterium]|nr:sensor domain-containing diguanylate cyclase [Selenomonadaceae bacterium]